MSDSDDRVAALETHMAALQARLAAVEERLAQAPSLLPFPPNLMMRFTQRGSTGPQDAGTSEGTLMYGGTVQVAGAPYHMQRHGALAPLLEMAPEALAEVFAALSNPHRIIILRILYQGPHTSQQLQEMLGMSSAGQLYHHLKELAAAGLIVQRERGTYSLDPTTVVPVFVAFMVASQLRFPGRSEEPAPDAETTLGQ